MNDGENYVGKTWEEGKLEFTFYKDQNYSLHLWNWPYDIFLTIPQYDPDLHGSSFYFQYPAKKNISFIFKDLETLQPISDAHLLIED